jgi:hypothetical protein
MATQSAPDTTLDGFVTRPLLAVTALIFLLNAPTLTVFGTPTAKIGGAVLYLGGALAMASVGKLVLIGSRHGLGTLR